MELDTSTEASDQKRRLKRALENCGLRFEREGDIDIFFSVCRRLAARRQLHIPEGNHAALYLTSRKLATPYLLPDYIEAGITEALAYRHRTIPLPTLHAPRLLRGLRLAAA